MIRALWTAGTGMEALQTNLDVIANNLANVNTTGFKKSRADFQDMLYQTTKKAGTETSSGSQLPVGVEVGMGSKIMSTTRMFTQGDVQQTDSPYDWVIQGDGFFQLVDNNGRTIYTRAGSFMTNNNGTLVNGNGLTLTPQVSIPQAAVSFQILDDGTWSATDANENKLATGRIQLARFINPSGLKSIGNNCYDITDASGSAVTGNPGVTGFGTIQQNAVEMSNVNVVEEMVNMIAAQRAYEMNTKAIQTADQILQMISNLKK
ncbi:MAG: flagellar basal-body rod protein FlgG [Syntrophales bacterium]|jgi:flagellar basal-body rod protein FlgG